MFSYLDEPRYQKENQIRRIDRIYEARASRCVPLFFMHLSIYIEPGNRVDLSHIASDKKRTAKLEQIEHMCAYCIQK